MKIAVIGGGFSAISLSSSMILESGAPLSKPLVKTGISLYVCEKQENIGLGAAYSTCYPWHLLNVRADRMGAVAGDPEGFYRWLENNESIWRNSDTSFQKLVIHKDAFLPRKLYGLYLSALLKEIRTSASNKSNCHFETIQKTVVNIAEAENQKLRVIFDDNQFLDVDKVILATGVLPIKPLPFKISSSRYIANLWDLKNRVLEQQICLTNKNSTIFIVGTGLTMIDMVTSLERLGYTGKIIALSRHGVLPAVRREHHLPHVGNIDKLLAPKSLLGKLRAFRRELKEIEHAGGCWQQLFGTIRPFTEILWKQLSIQDKKRFLRHLLFLWNKHRHRIAPESMKVIDRLLLRKQLKILSGKIVHIHEAKQIVIQYESDNRIETLQADFIYNCTGPDYTLHKNSDPLIQNLLSRGWITPDSLGLGIKSNNDFGAEGPFSSQIYVIGSLLLGDCFETTSVPEIRDQAKKILLTVGVYTSPSN